MRCHNGDCLRRTNEANTTQFEGYSLEVVPERIENTQRMIGESVGVTVGHHGYRIEHVLL